MGEGARSLIHYRIAGNFHGVHSVHEKNKTRTPRIFPAIQYTFILGAEQFSPTTFCMLSPQLNSLIYNGQLYLKFTEGAPTKLTLQYFYLRVH